MITKKVIPFHLWKLTKILYNACKIKYETIYKVTVRKVFFVEERN